MKTLLNLLNFKERSGLWFQSLWVRVPSATPLNPRKNRQFPHFLLRGAESASLINLTAIHWFLLVFTRVRPKLDPVSFKTLNVGIKASAVLSYGKTAVLFQGIKNEAF